MSVIKPVKPVGPKKANTNRVPNIPNKNAAKPLSPKSTITRKAGRGR